jgi:predicted flap endonuclease-1-like 5' DNA nuclease
VTRDSEVPIEDREPGAGTDAEGAVAEPTELKFVGPATAEVLAAATFDAADVAAKRVSYRMLVDAGVNPGVAAKIRRCHSLSWSFDSGSGLDRRSEQVRGLQDDERAWVAASSGDWADSSGGTGEEGHAGREGDWTPGDGPRTVSSPDATTTDDWTPGDWDAVGSTADRDETSADATADGCGDAEPAESAWRERSVPTPVTVIDGLGPDDAARLADAGITSVRSLAACTPGLVADSLGFEQSRVETWQERATDRLD